MLPPGRDDQAGDARADALWVAPCCQEADFGIGMGPVAAPEEVAGVIGGTFGPGEGRRLVGKAPGTDDGECVRQMRVDGPQKEEAVWGSDVADRQGTNVGRPHHGIGHGDASFEQPRRVRVQNAEARPTGSGLACAVWRPALITLWRVSWCREGSGAASVAASIHAAQQNTPHKAGQSAVRSGSIDVSTAKSLENEKLFAFEQSCYPTPESY